MHRTQLVARTYGSSADTGMAGPPHFQGRRSPSPSLPLRSSPPASPPARPPLAQPPWARALLGSSSSEPLAWNGTSLPCWKPAGEGGQRKSQAGRSSRPQPPHPRPSPWPTGFSGDHTTNIKARSCFSFIPSLPNEPQRLPRGAEDPGRRATPPGSSQVNQDHRGWAPPQPGEARGLPHYPPSLLCTVPPPHAHHHGTWPAVHPATF